MATGNICPAGFIAPLVNLVRTENGCRSRVMRPLLKGTLLFDTVEHAMEYSDALAKVTLLVQVLAAFYGLRRVQVSPWTLKP